MDIAKIQAEVRAELAALAERIAKRVLGELLADYNVEAARTVDALVPDAPLKYVSEREVIRDGHTTVSGPHYDARGRKTYGVAPKAPQGKRYNRRKAPQGKRYNIEAADVLNTVRLLGEASIAQIRAHGFPRASVAAVRRRLRELVADGKIRVTGEKRQTRYKVASRRARRA